MELRNTLDRFFQKHRDPDRPVLLALSGGPDSLALFDLLKQTGVSFGVAHVDHGWREESGEEAAQLKQMCAKLPFHCKKIPFNPSEGACRTERLNFFKELTQKFGYQATLLGHHSDDQAETVLKRVLEGASLPNLGGISEVSEVEGVTLWRPLLNHSKREILEWIEACGLTPFFDATNEDPKYLRGRMRQEVIPELSRAFGKQVKNSLLHLGAEVQQMRAFLETSLTSHLTKIERSPRGVFLDLNQDSPETLFEMKYLVRAISPVLSRTQVETAATLLLEGEANKRVGLLYIDRKRLFLPYVPLQPLPDERVTLISQMSYGPWEVTVKATEEESHAPPTWKDVWRGSVSITLPKGEYMIGPPPKTRNNQKIPLFLKQLAPVIYLQGEVYHEFIAGKINREPNMGRERIEISLNANRLCGIIRGVEEE